ncbi:sirohydrochlorin chelatase, partial [Dietzia psychralcaliphila]
ADAVVLGAAGSRDESSQAETRALAASLGRLLRVPATAGFASAASPTVTEAIAGFREQGHRRVAVATHLLAPGFFADRLAAAGADVTSPPLGANPEIVDLIVRLYLENSAGLIR